MSNNYERDVCNILKDTAIHQKLEELKEITKTTGRITGNEFAFDVCSDGRITEIIEGFAIGVDPGVIHKECNYQIDISFHSHPVSYSYPSPDDLLSDMKNRIRIASCVYGGKDDKVVCYRTSDTFRDKYKPILDETEHKYFELYEAYERATDLKERSKLFEQKWIAREKYENTIDKINLNIVKNIYPDIDAVDMYYDRCHRNPKFGNFGDVWVKDCGKI